ncbi:hypothetical protein HK101_008149 [Irineochytrium annulatum]|nr:hypothetical protein HK101_008149 [Irineochytrium annulatum]
MGLRRVRAPILGRSYSAGPEETATFRSYLSTTSQEGRPDPGGFFTKASKRDAAQTLPSPKSAPDIPTHRLPTADPLPYRPPWRRRANTFNDLTNVEASADHFAQAVARQDFRVAWHIYKRLHAPKLSDVEESTTEMPWPPEVLKLRADDHSTILSSLTRRSNMTLGARVAEMVEDNMIRAGHVPDLRDMNNVMLCHLRNGDVRRVVRAFERHTAGDRPLRPSSHVPTRFNPPMIPPDPSLDRRVIPDRRSFIILMAAYAMAGLHDHAEYSWYRMTRMYSATTLDAECHAWMIDAYAHPAVRDLDGVLRVYASYLKVAGGDTELVRDAAIRGIGICGDVESALALFSTYIDDGLIPSMMTLDSVIAIMEYYGSVERARSVWDKARALSPVLSNRDDQYRFWSSVSATFTDMEPAAQGEALWSPSQKKTLFPDLSMKAGMNRNWRQEIIPLQLHLHPNNSMYVPLACTWKRMLRIYLNNGDLASLEEIYAHYRSLEPIVDSEGMSILFQGYVRHGNLMDAEAVLKEMNDEAWVPTVRAWEEYERRAAHVKSGGVDAPGAFEQ